MAAPDIQMVDYMSLVPLLMASVQELAQRVEALEGMTQ